jgi:hypothetical protein
MALGIVKPDSRKDSTSDQYSQFQLIKPSPASLARYIERHTTGYIDLF